MYNKIYVYIIYHYFNSDTEKAVIQIGERQIAVSEVVGQADAYIERSIGHIYYHTIDYHILYYHTIPFHILQYYI